MNRGVGEHPLRRPLSDDDYLRGINLTEHDKRCIRNCPDLLTTKPLKPEYLSDYLTMEVSKGWLFTAPFFGYLLAWFVAL